MLEPPTTAVTPLNFTVSPDDDAAKLVPVIVTGVPTGPLAGENPVIVGGGGSVTVKFVLLVADCPETVTDIGPVVAPVGTVVTSDVAVALVTVAAVPLKVTLFDAGVVLKLVPEIVT